MDWQKEGVLGRGEDNSKKTSREALAILLQGSIFEIIWTHGSDFRADDKLKDLGTNWSQMVRERKDDPQDFQKGVNIKYRKY